MHKSNGTAIFIILLLCLPIISFISSILIWIMNNIRIVIFIIAIIAIFLYIVFKKDETEE